MADGRMREFVTFKIDAEEFAVDIANVREINRVAEVTRTPSAPSHVQGVINLRGKITPVVDLRTMLGFQFKAADQQNRIIVIEVGEVVVGLLVDAVSEVMPLPESAVEAPPTFAGTMASGCIEGVGKVDDRLLILLDIQKMFGTAEGTRGIAPD